MPSRMWRHGIHSSLELLRRWLPASLDHILAFIYLAYSMMALLYETVPGFEDTRIECLGCDKTRVTWLARSVRLHMRFFTIFLLNHESRKRNRVSPPDHICRLLQEQWTVDPLLCQRILDDMRARYLRGIASDRYLRGIASGMAAPTQTRANSESLRPRQRQCARCRWARRNEGGQGRSVDTFSR
jgi:hypothetical protein